MQKTPMNREGFAMVTTLLIVLVLGVLAVGVVWVASAEKKTSFAEGVHVAAVFAADAGTEAGINFIRVSDSPPQILDFATNQVRNLPETVLDGTTSYEYDARFMQKRPKPGWGVDYLDYDYQIGAMGNAGRTGEAGVDVVCSRLFKEGY